ncbi:LacI family DNA-binding transcriptional regulator, partial [Candidatus Sumerlaeota bacterium]|nr:LacI family DNA-binding transcriptional regulator [Candidatus Sumerlaeota bacterium]
THRKKLLNIREIARLSGVSYITVSRVLNDSPLVKESTKKRVQQVIEKHGYTPNLIARGLRKRKSNTIGLIITNMTYPFFPEIVQAIEDEALNNNYDVIICDSQGDKDKEVRRLKALLSRRVDGLIAAPINQPGNNNLETYQEIVDRNIPVVIINYPFPLEKSDFVGVDDYPAAQEATEYLISLGHRRIAFFHDVFAVGEARLKGYISTLKKHGIPVEKELIFMRDIQHEGIRKGIGDELDGFIFCQKALAMQDPPTAIFCSNDAIAIGAYRAIAEQGLKIPEDISILGFDNVPYSAFLYVPLTTISQPMEEIGRTAFHLLLERINSPERSSRRVLVETELVIRSSCAPPARERIAMHIKK